MQLKDLFSNIKFIEYLRKYLPILIEESHARHRDKDGLNQNVGEDRESILKCLINHFCLTHFGFLMIEKLSKKSGFDWLERNTGFCFSVKSNYKEGFTPSGIKNNHASGIENQKESRKKFVAKDTILLFISKDKRIASLYLIPASVMRTHVKYFGKKKILTIGKGDSKGLKISKFGKLLKNRNVQRLEIQWITPSVLTRDDLWEERRKKLEQEFFEAEN